MYVICYKYGIPMIRTQVYLTDEQARDIKLRALREKKREAVLIRELLDAGLNATASKPRRTAQEALLRLAKIGAKGPADLSQRLDDYLYGDSK